MGNGAIGEGLCPKKLYINPSGYLKPSPIAQSAIVFRHPPASSLPLTIRKITVEVPIEGTPVSGYRERILLLSPSVAFHPLIMPLDSGDLRDIHWLCSSFHTMIIYFLSITTRLRKIQQSTSPRDDNKGAMIIKKHAPVGLWCHFRCRLPHFGAGR